MWLVEGDTHATMLKIAGNPSLLRLNILVDMLTALGVIFLGAMLYETLKGQNPKIALVGLAFYILEGALLAGSRLGTISLLHFSQEYATTGGPEILLSLAKTAIESMDFVGDTLHVLAFCLGGILFYYLLNRSKLVPRWLSLWGLVAIIPVLVGTLTAIFNYDLPFILFLPYVPFELVTGIWIIVKGIPEEGQPPAE